MSKGKGIVLRGSRGITRANQIVRSGRNVRIPNRSNQNRGLPSRTPTVLNLGGGTTYEV